MNMTSFERVKMTLQHKEPDRIPFDLGGSVHTAVNDNKFAECYNKIKELWGKNIDHYLDIMEESIKLVSDMGAKYGIPVGNTEGWGAIYWRDHPDLDWEWIKEAGEICARLGYKYNYKFNCSSNFTHPHFAGIWEDIEWHQKVTGIIKGDIL